MIIFNLSPFNIPSDKSLYNQTELYFQETEKKFGLAAYHENDIGIGMTSYHNEIMLLKDVQPAFKLLLSELNKAEKSINIEVFIIHNDQMGKQFQKLLIKKAQQGVNVRFLYDAWGSYLTPKSFFEEMRKNGVKVAAYNPLLSCFLKGSLSNRLHRKIIIIDGKKSFIGGENIGDEYLGKNTKLGFWKDTGIFFIGDATHSLQQVFLNDWLKSQGEKILDKNFFPDIQTEGNQVVKIIIGGPDSPITDMSQPYIRLINNAKNKILIESPYFFPDNHFLEALYKSVMRNVDIHLILPSKNDNKLAEILQPIYIKKLLKHGIKVSTYNGGFIHSKVMIIDNQMASVGTANLDPFSFFRCYEVNSIIYDEEIIQQLQNDFFDNLTKSTIYKSADSVIYTDRILGSFNRSLFL